MNRKRKKEKRFYRVGECLYRWSHTGTYYYKGQIGERQFLRSLHTDDLIEAKREFTKLRHELGYLDPAAAHTATLTILCDLYRPRFAHLSDHTRDIKERILKRIRDEWPTGG